MVPCVLIRTAAPLFAMIMFAATAAAGPWTVDQVADIAVRSHPLVLRADAETAASAARKGQAESPWYPSVTLSTGYSRTRSFSAQSEQSTTTPNEFLRGDLSVLLTDFGRTRASANLYGARAQLSQAENDLRVARITLLNRMGVDGPADFLLFDSLAAETIGGTLPDWISEAERNRPELKALRDRERAAAQAARFARGGHLPALAGDAGYGYAADEAPPDQNYTVGVTLSVPVFSGFLTREQVKEAEASLSSVRHELTDARRRVLLQVEQAAYGVSEASERIGARKKEREASDENLRLATARYEVGAGDIIEMIDAQVQMTLADTATIDAQYDYSVSVATLLRAVGR